MSWLIRGQAKWENFIEIKSAAGREFWQGAADKDSPLHNQGVNLSEVDLSGDQSTTWALHKSFCLVMTHKPTITKSEMNCSENMVSA